MNMTEKKVAALVRQLLGGLVAHPSDIELYVDHSGGTTSEMSLRCNAEDMPRVLGKGGAHFRAVKAIAAAVGDKEGRIVQLTELRQPNKGEPAGRFPAFRFKPDWPREAVENILRSAAEAVFRHPVRIESEQSGERCRMAVIVSPAEESSLVLAIAPQLIRVIQSVGFTQGCVVSGDVRRGE